jgi:hypothetical protein
MATIKNLGADLYIYELAFTGTSLAISSPDL